ncbi:hypothetical protein FTV88_2534 [Heliorestis convoluta]|uniref:Uncharacterized protein n=1 Tax=Heliorestis convoluta TaxID=356322 RepID=A0A5Q2N1E3_9FIRM|nr:hypothetical protein FTV88_2534 [Heliorestis convoluta]
MYRNRKGFHWNDPELVKTKRLFCYNKEHRGKIFSVLLAQLFFVVWTRLDFG